MRIRILPMTMATAAILMMVKTVEIVRGTENLIIARVEAEAPPAAPPPADKKADEAKPAEAKKDAAKEPAKDAAAKDKPVADAPKEAAKEGAKEESKGEGGEKKEKKNPAVSEEAPPSLERHYTVIELELLQNLAKRSEEVARWERNVEIKEQTLAVAEKRIDEKTMQIDNMKKEVADMLAKYNEMEDAKIHSLVKIYESMKPKDAARIFDTLEMPVLLLVVDKMSEKKIAPVLAEMNPLRARQITVELAEERRINSAKLVPPPATGK